MTGQLKVLFDRNVYAMMTENIYNMPVPRHKGKKALAMTACTTNMIGDFFAGESRGAHKAMHEIMHYSGIKIVGYINKCNSKNNKEISINLRNKIKRASNRL